MITVAEGKEGAICPECGRGVLVNKNDEVRAHAAPGDDPRDYRCPGSHWIPEECAAEMRSRGFEPHPNYIAEEGEFHAEGELRAELRSALDKEGTERQEFQVVAKGSGSHGDAESSVLHERGVAESFAHEQRRHYPTVQLRVRTIITFEDASKWRGPWEEVNDGKA